MWPLHLHSCNNIFAGSVMASICVKCKKCFHLVQSKSCDIQEASILISDADSRSVSVSPCAKNLWMLVTHTPSMMQAMISASLHLHQCCPTGAHLQVRAIWHRRLSHSVIWELPCSKQHWAHTGPDKRQPWQLVGHVFPRPRWTREFSICKPVEGFRLCK